MKRPASRSRRHPSVAYFCMEYGLDASFRIYSGGLGILAGDYLKGAHDLRLPMVGVGLLWRQGYVDQGVDPDGRVYEAYRQRAYDFLEDTGVTVTVPIRRAEVVCRVWRCTAFGNAPLYLLDTEGPGSADPTICDKLYGGNGEQRVAQEMVLGIGGVRALRALGIRPDVYHFNEGHAVFAGLELLREERAAGATFDAALDRVRQRVVFTTHTPIEAGNETHPVERLLYMGADAGLSIDRLAAIGGVPFNMTAAALRLSRGANAVAVLHGQTARRMWAHLAGAPRIEGITNGVHPGTWADPRVGRAAGRRGGALRAAHLANKRALLGLIAERTGTALREDRLLVAFSRRATSYKRWDLVFRDDRIAPLLRAGKLQLVFAGKSHPLDHPGRALVEKVIALTRRFPAAVAFLPNYDMDLGRALTRGADVWLNCPRRPLEASGTSGMKAAMNGVLNLSILDGWWPEACRHGVNGWQFGDGREFADAGQQDAHDFRALLRVLRREVIPAYYDEPARWDRMMRASVRDTRKAFSVHRMLREYFGRLYA